MVKVTFICQFGPEAGIINQLCSAQKPGGDVRGSVGHPVGQTRETKKEDGKFQSYSQFEMEFI